MASGSGVKMSSSLISTLPFTRYLLQFCSCVKDGAPALAHISIN